MINKHKVGAYLGSIGSTILLILSCMKISEIPGNADYGWLVFFLTGYLEFTSFQIYHTIKQDEKK